MAAVREAVRIVRSNPRSRRALPFLYLERSLISPLRKALTSQLESPVRLRLSESPNKVGMLVLSMGAIRGTAAIPKGCTLRPLTDYDADYVNAHSSPGPNCMDRARVGCWGIAVSGTLKGWA